jgi:hypothetical protein
VFRYSPNPRYTLVNCAENCRYLAILGDNRQNTMHNIPDRNQVITLFQLSMLVDGHQCCADTRANHIGPKTSVKIGAF